MAVVCMICHQQLPWHLKSASWSNGCSGAKTFEVVHFFGNHQDIAALEPAYTGINEETQFFATFVGDVPQGPHRGARPLDAGGSCRVIERAGGCRSSIWGG
eukprot:scaffold305049_cov15-Tisochrysis_lutea.AAC.1